MFVEKTKTKIWILNSLKSVIENQKPQICFRMYITSNAYILHYIGDNISFRNVNWSNFLVNIGRYPKILALNYCIYWMFRIKKWPSEFFFLCKVIPRSEHPHFLRPMKTKHLVLKTKLHPKEFNGIRLLLLTCPYLETLTIDLLPPSPIAVSCLDVKLYTLKKELYNIYHIIKPCDNDFIFPRRHHHMLASIHRHIGCKTCHTGVCGRH